MSTAELVLMTLADARLPTGAHTQSAGLEAAVNAGLADEGRRLEEVVAYARDRLRTVVTVDAGTAVLARQLALNGDDPFRAEPHWAARTPSGALRAASRLQGRGYLRLAARVWPEVLDHLPADAAVARPIVLGVVAAVTGLTAGQTGLLVGYDDVQTVVAASLKLLPVDPFAAAAWLTHLHPDIEHMAAVAAAVVDVSDLPASGAPMIDVLAQRHVHEERRLFHA